MGVWVAGLSKLITNSAQAEARARAELGKIYIDAKSSDHFNTATDIFVVVISSMS